MGKVHQSMTRADRIKNSKRKGKSIGRSIGGLAGHIVGTTVGSSLGMPLVGSVVGGALGAGIGKKIGKYGGKVLGSLKKGGFIKKTGKYYLHKGELVIPSRKLHKFKKSRKSC